MIALADARRIAREHVEAEPQPHPDYRIVLGPEREVPIGWYFDYGIECLKDISEDQREEFAGAPGFLIRREDGDVEEVSWGQYQDMGLQNEPKT